MLCYFSIWEKRFVFSIDARPEDSIQTGKKALLQTN